MDTAEIEARNRFERELSIVCPFCNAAVKELCPGNGVWVHLERIKRADALELKLYISHEDVRVPENGVAYFGPFSPDEITERLNDSYADALADSGNVDAHWLIAAEYGNMYINPREYWMEQLEKMEDESGPGSFMTLACGFSTQDDEAMIDHYVAGCDTCEDAHAPDCTNNPERHNHP